MRELTLPGRLILLPGLGSSPAIFEHQRRAFGNRLETPAMIEHRANESVSAYAQRWAQMLSRPDDDRPLFIGGVSFGGILAQEMAMYLRPKPRAVLLISSTREADRVAGLMQLLELLVRFIPERSVKGLLPMAQLGFALRDGLDDDDKRRLIDGSRELDGGLIKWAAGVAVGWPGYREPAGYPPVHQIHAKRDWVIRPPSAGQAGVQMVEGPSHLLHMTHAQTVNRFLFDRMMEYCPEARMDTPAIEDPHTTAARRLVLEGAPAGTPMV